MRYIYQEFSGEHARDFDPVKEETPCFRGNEPHRFTAELIKYVAQYPSLLSADTANCVGCDAARLASACFGCLRPKKDGDLLDVVIIIEKNWTEWIGLHSEHDKEDSAQELTLKLAGVDPADHIIVCRCFERSCGHGMKWFRISPEQAIELAKQWEAAAVTL